MPPQLEGKTGACSGHATSGGLQVGLSSTQTPSVVQTRMVVQSLTYEQLRSAVNPLQLSPASGEGVGQSLTPYGGGGLLVVVLSVGCAVGSGALVSTA
jgi:hypothetical protein